MNQPDINIFAYLINSVAIVLMVLIFMSTLLRVSQLFIAVLAYPIYLAFYYLEYLYIKNKGSRQILSLNIPEEGQKRFVMNLSASLVTLLIIPNFLKIYSVLSIGKEAQAKIIIDIMLGSSSYQMWSNIFLILFIFIIYSISYVTDIDDRDPMTKIEQLSIPSLWKGVLKKI